VKRFILTVAEKSAEGKVGHAVGGDIEAVQDRKAEQQTGLAGTRIEGPEGYSARGIKERARKKCDS
jgi:hypothetical protein